LNSIYLDTDQLKFPEYVIGFTSIPSTVTDLDIIPAFQVFDLEKTGFIPADEILKSLMNVGETLDEIESKAFKENMKIDEQGSFDYNGRKISIRKTTNRFVLFCFRILSQIYFTAKT